MKKASSLTTFFWLLMIILPLCGLLLSLYFVPRLEAKQYRFAEERGEYIYVENQRLAVTCDEQWWQDCHIRVAEKKEGHHASFYIFAVGDEIWYQNTEKTVLIPGHIFDAVHAGGISLWADEGILIARDPRNY